ncbi:MAG: PDZ domain-containing protein [Verrucomicrobia bacterium]|nr:PDZ domain-containing protein [Verrucomicrobiota bacterium]
MHKARPIARRAPLSVLLLSLASLAHADVEFHVSPDGNDANPGTRARPFASLHHARQVVARRADRSQPVTVFLAGGTYYLVDTLVFQAADSGTKDAPITYAALPGQTPVVSGGQKLRLTWSPHKDGIMQAAVPPGTTADQLFVNGQRQHMARYPNYDPKAAQFNGSAADAFGAARAARWADPVGGFMHAMHSALWGDMHYLITGKDPDGNLTYVGGWQNNRRSQPHRQFRFVENIFEELDAPGEWFIHAKTATLYFYPPADLKLGAATVEIVRLRHLVEFRGTQTAPVRFVTLRGITFRHAARTFMDNREPLLRSDWTTYRGGAILFNGAEDCTIQDATIDQVGGNAIFVNQYNRRIAVKDSIISEAGANGVAFVGSPEAVRSPLFEYGQTLPVDKIDRTPGPKTEDYPADCLVDDCLLYRTGRFEKQTAPIQVSMAMSITVRHCSIYDVPRTGINIGDGCWGGHTIEFCDVFDTVKETGDHGSFNSWGRDRFWLPSTSATSTRVAANPDLPLLDVIKPITVANSRWRCDHGWDIDLDDGSSNYRIVNNLLLNGGLKNREGYHRIVENNIILGERKGSFHPHVWYNKSRDVFRNNIVSTTYKPIGMPRGPWGEFFDHNILHTPGQAASAPASALQNASGRDEHSILADLSFANPATGDFRLKDGSPALALGFKNFPMDQFGVTNPKLKALARTPFVSDNRTAPQSGSVARDSGPRDFLGGKVKNVVGLGEVSAYGLPGEVGAILTQVPAGSAAAKAGLKEGDVILKCRGVEVRSVDGLLTAFSGAAKGTKVILEVWRLQEHVSVEVSVE